MNFLQAENIAKSYGDNFLFEDLSLTIDKNQKVALIGAGSQFDFRREDKMGCAYLGQKLIAAGYEPENESTASIVDTWSRVDPREAAGGRSAGYLKRSGQEHDLTFILDNFDDLDFVPIMAGRELVMAKQPPTPIAIEDYAALLPFNISSEQIKENQER